MNPYIEQNILNADPVELIRILYRHGIVSVRDAREHLRMGRHAEAAKSLLGSARAVAELDRALRPEAAPEIAMRLRRLYRYIQGRMLEAAANRKDEPLVEVLGLLTTLLEAWQFDSAPAPTQPASLAWQAAMTAENMRGRIEIHA